MYTAREETVKEKNSESMCMFCLCASCCIISKAWMYRTIDPLCARSWFNRISMQKQRGEWFCFLYIRCCWPTVWPRSAQWVAAPRTIKSLLLQRSSKIYKRRLYDLPAAYTSSWRILLLHWLAIQHFSIPNVTPFSALIARYAYSEQIKLAWNVTLFKEVRFIHR
jgi:hypothetical protein